MVNNEINSQNYAKKTQTKMYLILPPCKYCQICSGLNGYFTLAKNKVLNPESAINSIARSLNTVF